jgi:hypothetical protein
MLFDVGGDVDQFNIFNIGASFRKFKSSPSPKGRLAI